MTIEKILLNFSPRRKNLLPALKQVNEHFGVVSEEAIKQMAHFFGLTKVEVFSVASFYDQIRTEQPAELIIQVCDGANCTLKKSNEVIKQIELFFKQKVGDNFNPKVKIERIGCLAQCPFGPNVVINGIVYEKVFPDKVTELLRSYTEK